MLAVALLAVAGLGFLGAGVEGKLSPTSLEIPGSASARANNMLREHFGDSAPFVILLRGPARQLDRQGPALVRTLRRNPAVTTLSPWDLGAVQRLRPTPREAIVVADFHVGTEQAVNHTVPELNQILASTIKPPVRSTQTGYATLSRAIQDDSITATRRGELIALPILLIVLLLVFRSPVAAGIPLAFGAVTVIASRGLLSILTNWFSVDAFALVVCTMMGLALGVDYALLMVSRFREELTDGATPYDAARATRRTAGRTTVFAGSTLMLSMLVAFFIVPGSLLGSLAATLLIVVALSVLVAVVVGPAVLILCGPNVDRWRIGPAPGQGRSRLMTIVSAALRRPAPVAIAIGVVVLILAAPGGGAEDRTPEPDPACPRRPDQKGLRNDRAGDRPGIRRAVRGRRQHRQRHRHRTEPAGGAEPLAAPDRRPARRADGGRPGAGLAGGGAAAPGRRHASPVAPKRARWPSSGGWAATSAGPRPGVALLRGGIAKASYGAGLLAEGSGKAADGATLLASGLAQAETGSERAVGALAIFAEGTRRLAGAQHRAALAGLNLKFALQSLGPNLRHNALRRSRHLRQLARRRGAPDAAAPAGAGGRRRSAAEDGAATARRDDDRQGRSRLRTGAGRGPQRARRGQRHQSGQRRRLRPRLRRPAR